jgi:DNA-binding SARP family transcriptional activator
VRGQSTRSGSRTSRSQESSGETRDLGNAFKRHRSSAAPSELPQGIYLHLLGGFELLLGAQAVLLPKTARRLLAFLAFSPRPLARTYVSQSLWLDTTERHADGNLRSALWKVSQFTLSAIAMSGGQLALGDTVTVDYQDNVGLARRLLHDSRSLADRELDEMPFVPDLLPGWYEEWIVTERERYRQLRLHALEYLCQELVLRQRFAHAVQAGLAAVSGEPLRESANICLIRAYIAEGNVGEAIRHYQCFTRLLRDELRVTPSPAMRRLIEQVAEC